MSVFIVFTINNANSQSNMIGEWVSNHNREYNRAGVSYTNRILKFDTDSTGHLKVRCFNENNVHVTTGNFPFTWALLKDDLGKIKLQIQTKRVTGYILEERKTEYITESSFKTEIYEIRFENNKVFNLIEPTFRTKYDPITNTNVPIPTREPIEKLIRYIKTE
jgi:hypothetical protein